MSFDLHKNFASTLVATAPSPATTGLSLVVTTGEGALLPTGTFNATVGPAGVEHTAANSEIVRATRTTDTLAIVRQQEGTSARTIVIGDVVRAGLTAKSLTDIEQNFLGPPFEPPVDGDFAWVNQGSASVSTGDQGILMTTPAASGDSFRCRVKSAPATPYVITAAFQPLSGVQASNSSSYGLLFREVATGELHTLLVYQSPLGPMISLKMASATAASAVYLSTTQNTLPIPQSKIPLMWLRIADDGANRICSYSLDGYEWTVFHTIGRTDFLTADQVGFFVNSQHASVGCKVRLLSWRQS